MCQSRNILVEVLNHSVEDLVPAFLLFFSLSSLQIQLFCRKITTITGVGLWGLLLLSLMGSGNPLKHESSVPHFFFCLNHFELLISSVHDTFVTSMLDDVLSHSFLLILFCLA